MRIAIFTDTFYPAVDGVVISIVNEALLLAKKGHHVFIFAPRYGKGDKIFLHKNITICRFASIPVPTYKDFRLVMPNMFFISLLLRKFNPHVVHIETYSTLSWAGAILAKKQNRPLVGTFHTLATEFLTYLSLKRILMVDRLLDPIIPKKDTSDFTPISKSIGWIILRTLYNKCDFITAPSKIIKTELIKRRFNKKIEVISNGIDLKKCRPKKDYKSDNPLLIHVGRIGHEKNPEVLIQVVAILKKKYPNITLSIVGDGPAMSKINSMIDDLDLKDNIHLYGKIPNERIYKLCSKHDIFITASTIETQGIVLLEAMGCGLPIVGVNKYAIPEIVIHGKNGYVAEPFDEVKLAHYVEKLYCDESLRRKFGKESLRIVKEHDIHESAEKFEKLYLSIIDPKKR